MSDYGDDDNDYYDEDKYFSYDDDVDIDYEFGDEKEEIDYGSSEEEEKAFSEAEDDYEEYKQVYLHDYGTAERVQKDVGGGLSTIIDTTTKLGKLQEKIRVQNATPEEKFNNKVNELTLKMDSEGLIAFTDEDRQKLLGNINSFSSRIRYLNPAGYVLGFLASGGPPKYQSIKNMGQLDASNVKYIIQLSDNTLFTKYNITPPDVVRYARLWNIYG